MTFDFKKEYKVFYMPKNKDEGATIVLMDAYLEQNGYVNDMSMERLHHEIYRIIAVSVFTACITEREKGEKQCQREFGNTSVFWRP